MIHIIDNYFSDPYKVRSRALINHEKFKSDSMYSWPGKRWHSGVDKFTTRKIVDDVNHLTGSLLTHMQIHYQSTTKENYRGVIHSDQAVYTVLIFLTPNPPPFSGISVYKTADQLKNNINLKKKSFNNKRIKSTFLKSKKNWIDRWRYDRELKKYHISFGEGNHIVNEFNRCVIFPSNRFHNAQNFFGDNINDSRLTIIGFIS